MPKIFEAASNGIAPAILELLTILRRVADDGSRFFGGWLGCFSPPNMPALRVLDPFLGVDEEKLPRACSGGEMDGGSKNTDPLKLHASSTRLRCAS